MKYFFRLAQNIEVLPLMESLMRHPELWNSDQVRTTFDDSPHTQVDDILLRFGKPDGDSLEAWDSPVMKLLPGVKPICLNIMALVKGSRLGRVIISKLEPGNKILAHKDILGEYSRYYTRYHLVLQGLNGSLFTCGDETVNMLTGELWWFNAHEEHSVQNNSKDDRVHLLIDVRIDD